MFLSLNEKEEVWTLKTLVSAMFGYRSNFQLRVEKPKVTSATNHEKAYIVICQ